MLAAIQVPSAIATTLAPEFYSPSGSENQVSFDHVYHSNIRSIEQLTQLTPSDRQALVRNEIRPLLQFLFGPLTHRHIGGAQRDELIDVHWTRAHERGGRVLLPYTYKGIWIIEKTLASRTEFSVPVPLRYESLFSPKWKRCTDTDPEHATPSFYWYFWDPERYGCDHKLGEHYDNVPVRVGIATPNEPLSYPEYERMIRRSGNQQSMSLTVAFGYVQDPRDPDPETDLDAGAAEYRAFVRSLNRKRIAWTESAILLREYQQSGRQNRRIGTRFKANLRGVDLVINVVMSAGVDQMHLFAKSFAHDHDSFFAWMGHSRVGDGFDAAKMQNLLNTSPGFFSITDQYQMVYWGGCNSYSYYTLPFFQFKASAFPANDPHGTRNLDILAHGLPSYFSLNSTNASAVVDAILSWQTRPSYQDIVNRIEENASRFGTRILAAVLGDEDNPQ